MIVRRRMKRAVRLLAGVALFHHAVSFAADAIGKATYVTYFGGSGTVVNAMTSDSQGNVFLAGVTFSADLPVTAGSYHPKPYPCTPSGCASHAFAAKIGASGGLVWSTYLGGNTNDAATGIAVDASGNAYVAGLTGSTDFPVTADAVRTSGGGVQGFVVKFDAAGAKLLYGTYLGGSDQVRVSGIAWGARGGLVVTGTADSAGFPQVNPVERKTGAGNYAFVMGWRSSDMTLVFSSLLGGSGTTAAHAAAIGGDGSVYVAGSTNSSDFPLKNAIPGLMKAANCPLSRFTPVYPCPDAFVTKLTADGQSLIYSTLLGGSQADSGTAIAIDAAGSALVAGNTASADFPLVHAAAGYPGDHECRTGLIPYSTTPCPHGFAAKLAPEGSRLMYSTYLGGKDAAVLAAAAADEAGSLWVAGTTMGNSFPASGGAQQHCNAAQGIFSAAVGANQGMDGIEFRGTAGILAKVQGDGTLEHASYFGGTGDGEQIRAAAAAGSNGLVRGLFAVVGSAGDAGGGAGRRHKWRRLCGAGGPGSGRRASADRPRMRAEQRDAGARRGGAGRDRDHLRERAGSRRRGGDATGCRRARGEATGGNECDIRWNGGAAVVCRRQSGECDCAVRSGREDGHASGGDGE